jgi:short-subunit dehydrogenase
VVTADVADRQALEDAARVAIERFGRIDTWVNNAGITVYGRLEEVSDADNRRLFDTNFWGTVNGSLVAMPYLARQGGALINVGSEVSDAVLPLQGMYSASKHAVKGFTDALRVEIQLLDKSPVEVVLIQPTAVDTPYPEHAANYMAQEPKLPTPMIQPEQVAEAILEAAVSGGRDITVGAMAKMDTLVSKVAPRLGDQMARMQADRQQRDEPAVDPQGALHRPSEDGRTHGRL